MTWNARALCHFSPSLRARKLALLRSHLARTHIAFIQECHGDDTEMRDLLYHEAQAFRIFTSPCSERDTGGLITLVSKTLLSDASHCTDLALVDGRILRVSIHFGDSKLVLVNVHNFGITAHDFHNWRPILEADITCCADHPNEAALLLAGDFNFCAPGELALSLSTPAQATVRAELRGWQREFRHLLERLTEIQQCMPTHYTACSSSLSRLDRIYVSMPPWMLVLLKARCSLLFSAKWGHEQRISDHAMVRCSLEIVPQLPPEERPIPRFVCSLPSFGSHHDTLCRAAALDSLPAVLRWETHKLIIKEAARVALDEHLLLHGQDGEAKGLTLSSIARAIWFCDCRLARVLLARSSIARELLSVTGSMVSLINPAGFAALVESDRRLALAERIAAADLDIDALHRPPRAARDAAVSSKRKGGHMAALLRLARLWSPFDKRMILTGVRCGLLPDGRPRIITAPSERLRLLRDAWRPVFSCKHTDTCRAQQILDEFASPIDCSQVSPPCIDDFVFAAAHVKNSAPGRDGLPYAAWRAAGLWGARTLLLVSYHLLSSLVMPVPFNDSIMLFVPKGEDELDAEAISRDPTDTRPLSLKNSDNKLICSVFNHKLRAPLAAAACELQRGFVHGRQLLANVVDLDVYGRIFGMESVRGDPAVLTFWDFAAAFPSVAHLWIFAVARAYKLPAGVCWVVRCMYFFNSAYSNVSGFYTFLFVIRAGVLQGCPLSGLLFALALDPFLRWMKRDIELAGLGRVRACADDIGSALRMLSALLRLYPIFVVIRIVTGMDVKPKKCIIVPTGAPYSPHLAECIKDWLCRNLPAWAAFHVKPSAKYLSFWLGPRSANLQWCSPAHKWSCRALLAAGADSAASTTILRYNTRALPVLGYVAQLIPVPHGMLKAERRLLYSLLHAPFNALGGHALFRLHEGGGPRIQSLSVLSMAARLRTATCTVTHWPELLVELHAAAEDHLPFARVVKGLVWPAFWDSPPFATHLAEAAALFPGSHDAHTALALRRNDISGVADGSIRFNGKSKPAVQALASQILVCALHRDSLASVCLARLRTLLPEHALEITHDRVDALLAIARKCRPHFAMCLIKTLSNSWCTSRRFHETNRLPCVFGCPDCIDTLEHYLCCGALWGIVHWITGSPPHPLLCGRLGLLTPSPRAVLHVFFAFHTYHAVKVGHRVVVDDAVSSLDFGPVHAVARSSARSAVAMVRRTP